MRLLALFWWIDRWRKSSAYMDMTLAEQGAYRNLLDEAHLRGGPLPLDERILAKACGDALAWPTVRPAVMARFEKRADGWHNRTLDAIMHESERRAEKQRNYRNRGNPTGNGGGNNTSNTDGSPSPSPSPSLVSVSGTKIKSVSSASDSLTPEPPAILLFPVTGLGAPTWPLTAALLATWTDAYPHLDVLAESRKALAWIHANRRKTARGMPRFLVAWLNRATNADTTTRAPLTPSSPPTTHETRPHPAGQRPHVPFDADWWDECKALHAGACDGDRMRHHLRIQTERLKASSA